MTSSAEQSPSAVFSAEETTDVEQARKLTRTRSSHDTSETCRVCGDGHARMHYGVLTCFGCKGFFRRTLKRATEYSCKRNGNCIVDRHERNSCRYCRFKRCLEVGMDPKAVRPDRDATGRHYQARIRRSKMFGSDFDSVDDTPIGDDWCRKLPVDMRTTLMQVMNIELIVNKGDTQKSAKELYPLPFKSLKQILSDPSLLDGSRTEMRYEPYRRVEESELLAIAHRRLIAIIDWVDNLFGIMDLQSTEDKLILVKSGFAPLTIFTFCTSTAKCTRDEDIVCLCNFGYVPRHVHRLFDEPYHLANRIIDRSLDDLVAPFRVMHLNDEEIVLLKAIIVLNSHLKHLSQEASEQIADLRDRIQETLYHVIRETHPKEAASSRFGNLLLFIPNIMILGNLMYENLQFIQSFGKQSIDPLLCELLDNIEPVDDAGLHFCDDPTDLPIRPSTSSSSVSSLASQESFSSQTTSEDNAQVDETVRRRLLLSPQQSFAPSNTSECTGLTNACSLPNLDQVESDPDYNITLTADMFSGIRQAIGTTQGMDVDTNDTPPNSPQFGCTPIATPKPQFFLDNNVQTMTTEKFGNRHKFTVTARRLSADQNNTVLPVSNGVQKLSLQRTDCNSLNPSPPIPVLDPAMPIVNGISSEQLQKNTLQTTCYGSYPKTQVPVTKTLSYPHSLAPVTYAQSSNAINISINKLETMEPHQPQNASNPISSPIDMYTNELLENGAQPLGYDAMDYY